MTLEGSVCQIRNLPEFQKKFRRMNFFNAMKNKSMHRMEAREALAKTEAFEWFDVIPSTKKNEQCCFKIGSNHEIPCF